ncbi:hypothetical protein FHS39_002180 [Streptomyces olivoverticillatus]|uniref:Uncharacterized protein n=1 Tax=Streptomyces olivoverticillatus TaxID=66427 RepID=A0A7W7PKF0_9ACTN|nr:hypothetical protein [Streptomyces olivoverticillatus]MBB4893149.1 hypothetical protein [Streptomyces olivoverticillatus]
MNIEQIMEKLGRSGVTVILKIDDERMAEGSSPWTVVLSGGALGEQGFIRAESSTLEGCIEQVVVDLRTRPGDWEWLSELF